jgi:ATP-dependent DNA ligase
MRSCVIDGDAIVCDANGLAVFDLLRRCGGNDVVLCAFDLLELDGRDLRRAPIEERIDCSRHGVRQTIGAPPPRAGFP